MKRGINLVLAAFALTALSYGLARFAYGLLLPHVRQDLALSVSAAGWIGGSAFAAYCVGIVATFVCSGKVSPRGLTVMAGAAAALGMGLMYMVAFLISAAILGWVAAINVSYPLVVLGLGGYWFYLTLRPVRTTNAKVWARRIFSVSILLILALNLSLALNAVLPSPSALYHSSGVGENHQTQVRGGLSESVTTAFTDHLEETHGQRSFNN